MKFHNPKFLSKIHLLFLVICFVGCHVKSAKEAVDSTKPELSTETNAFFTIPFAEIIKTQSKILLSSFAKDVEIIQFENIPEAMLGNVENIEFTKEFIFVKFWQHPVIQFSRDGKFIRNIGEKGQGPGEYGTCMKMSIDEKNERIYIHTGELSMMVFNFDGEYVRTIKYTALESTTNFWIWSRDSMLVSYFEPIWGNEPFVFIEHNEQGDTVQAIKNHIFYEKEEQCYNLSPFEEQNFSYRFENKLHLKGNYNDTVYSYDENKKIVPKFYIDLGKHKLPSDFIYERKWSRPLPENLCWTGVHETSNSIFIPYGYHYDVNRSETQKVEKGCIVYNKKTKEGVAVEESKFGGFIDDITGGPDFRPIVTNDNEAAMLVSAMDMKQYLDSEQFKNQPVKFPEAKGKLVQLNKTLKVDDNHFLMLVKLKTK
jgi:hypothetical protein